MKLWLISLLCYHFCPVEFLSVQAVLWCSAAHLDQHMNEHLSLADHLSAGGEILLASL